MMKWEFGSQAINAFLLLWMLSSLRKAAIEDGSVHLAEKLNEFGLLALLLFASSVIIALIAWILD